MSLNTAGSQDLKAIGITDHLNLPCLGYKMNKIICLVLKVPRPQQTSTEFCGKNNSEILLTPSTPSPKLHTINVGAVVGAGVLGVSGAVGISLKLKRIQVRTLEPKRWADMH